MGTIHTAVTGQQKGVTVMRLCITLGIAIALGLVGNAGNANADPNHKKSGHEGHGHKLGHEHADHGHGHGHAYGHYKHGRDVEPGREGVVRRGYSSAHFIARTGDDWINTRMTEVNDYGLRYREPFVNEVVTYYAAPRPLVIDLLGTRRWAPADVYYACAFAHSIGRPCAEVADRYQRNRADGWIAVEQSYGIEPASPQFVAFKQGFAATYGRWGHPVSVDRNEQINWQHRAGTTPAAGRVAFPVAVDVQSQRVAGASGGYSVRTGDTWVDHRMVEVNDYGVRYQEPFVNEMVTYYGAPRPLMVDLLETRRWAPGDVYYACSFAHSIGRPCGEVVDRYERNRTGGWGMVAQSYGIRPGSPQFLSFKRGFVGTYGRWGQTVALDAEEPVRWDDRSALGGAVETNGHGHAYGHYKRDKGAHESDGRERGRKHEKHVHEGHGQGKGHGDDRKGKPGKGHGRK